MDGEITPEELRAVRDDGEGPRIVDIRNPSSFAREHIPGSENVPLNALTDRIEHFDGEDHVVTVCPHGKASVQAARLLAAYEGFDGTVESLLGGLEAWDGPIESDEKSVVEGPEAPGSTGRASDGEGTGNGPEAPF